MSISYRFLMMLPQSAARAMRKFRLPAGAAVGVLAMVSLPAMAQTTPTSPAHTQSPQTHSPTRHHSRHAKPAPVAPPPVVVPPPAPLPPAEQPPQPAAISYQQGHLKVEASNSSLSQTLTAISQKTGLKVEGLNQDRRIYGQYGPGLVSEVVSKLLDGAGYNYVLVGGSAQSPAKLVLSPGGGGVGPPSFAANAAPAPQVSNPEPQNEEMSDPSQPPHPKTPQEIFEELRRSHPQQQIHPMQP